jgi:ethanolamine utilization protein EutN
MHLATVIGTATSTVKHPSLQGWPMLIVQPLTFSGRADGDPLIAVDRLGSQVGGRVIISSDGKAVREAMNTENTPVRWMIIGQPDNSQETTRTDNVPADLDAHAL